MVQQIHGLSPQRVAQVVSNRVHSLQQFLTRDHFAFRGTFDAAIAEAQGAAMPRDRKTSPTTDFRSPIDHIQNLDNGRRAVARHLQQVDQVITEGVLSRNARAGSYLHVILRPLRQLAMDREQLANQTMQLIGDLRAAGHQALAGAPIMAKGRTEAALVSSQLRNMNSPWPGSRELVPRSFLASPSVVDTLAEIARLPLDETSAGQAVAEEAACSRKFVREALRQAPNSPELVATGTALLRMWSPSGELLGSPVGGREEYYNYVPEGGDAA